MTSRFLMPTFASVLDRCRDGTDGDRDRKVPRTRRANGASRARCAVGREARHRFEPAPASAPPRPRANATVRCMSAPEGRAGHGSASERQRSSRWQRSQWEPSCAAASGVEVRRHQLGAAGCDADETDTVREASDFRRPITRGEWAGFAGQPNGCDDRWCNRQTVDCRIADRSGGCCGCKG